MSSQAGAERRQAGAEERQREGRESLKWGKEGQEVKNLRSEPLRLSLFIVHSCQLSCTASSCLSVVVSIDRTVSPVVAQVCHFN